jgi:hypothetical protein
MNKQTNNRPNEPDTTTGGDGFAGRSRPTTRDGCPQAIATANYQLHSTTDKQHAPYHSLTIALVERKRRVPTSSLER